MSGAEPVGVAFAEAIAFLRERLKLSESEWLSVLRGAQAAAEASVDAQAEAMGRDFLAAIVDIVAAGGTSRDFRAQYDAIAERYGWASAGDPGWHAELIWRMQVFTAQAAGRWEQMRRLAEARPDLRYFFRYVTAGDHRVRPAHREWDGIILPIDHPFWLTHWPPNGFNCRCNVQLVGERDLVRYGWSVTAGDDPRLALPPDPGFSGNAGMAWAALRGGRPGV